MTWSVYTKSYHCPIVVSPRFRLNHHQVFDRFKEKDHSMIPNGAHNKSSSRSQPCDYYKMVVPDIISCGPLGNWSHKAYVCLSATPWICPSKTPIIFNIQIVINWVMNVYLVHPFCNIHSNYNNIIIHNGGFYASTFWYYEVLFDPVN